MVPRCNCVVARRTRLLNVIKKRLKNPKPEKQIKWRCFLLRWFKSRSHTPRLPIGLICHTFSALWMAMSIISHLRLWARYQNGSRQQNSTTVTGHAYPFVPLHLWRLYFCCVFVHSFLVASVCFFLFFSFFFSFWVQVTAGVKKITAWLQICEPRGVFMPISFCFYMQIYEV